MTKAQRTTFEQAIGQTLEIVKKESPLSVSKISELSEIDSRTVARVLEFLIDLQDEFAKTVIKMLDGNWGKIIWRNDRIDKMKLPERVREWYIKKRYFDETCHTDMSQEQLDTMFDTEKRTSIEEAIRRTFIALEIEDDITISELARRTKVNRNTMKHALDLILEFQDEIARSFITRKELVIWRERPPLHQLDETSLKYLLQLWYCPEEIDHIPDEKEKELLLIS